MTKLAVVGIGLVSPLGITPEEHAFYLRAEVHPATPGGFVDGEGAPLRVAYCSWMGARLPVAMRLSSLARAALRTALAPVAGPPLQEATGRISAAFHLVTSAPRAGLADADSAALEADLAGAFDPPRATRSTGEAAFFGALASAAARLQQGPVHAAVIVAADSFIGEGALAEWQRLRQMPWEADLPIAGEVAAAVTVMLPAFARRAGIEILATIHHAAIAQGDATDDNDAIIDGAAMTGLLRSLPPMGSPARASFGPHGVGSLRRREWEMAAARLPGHVDSTCDFVCLESRIGLAGAAAGAAGLVYGIAVHRHGAWASPRAADAPFVAWAISPDGARGLAAATVGA